MKKVLIGIAKLMAVLLSVCITGTMLLAMSLDSSLALRHFPQMSDKAVMDQYDQYAQQKLDAAKEAALGVKKRFWLQDDELIAPEPDPAKYGTSRDPSELGWLLEEAEELLDGQETVFSTETVLAPGTEAIYYLDETIFAVTWKEAIDYGMYTFSEVKIAHPSQLRRYLSGGGPYTGALQITTEMARHVNAVVASNGDFYANRKHGIVVYDGIVYQVEPWYVDTCYIDEQGNMLFSYAGELRTFEEAQRFVDENNIRFSIAFGPVIKDGDRIGSLDYYAIGEVTDTYARAALCQKGELHYLVAVLNREGWLDSTDTLYGFAQNIMELGVEKAYTLDGGQTGVIVTQDKLINNVVKGFQRGVSDIFYFATAVPDGS